MDPETARIEHLKLVQGIVTRIGRNSFAIKSAAATAVAVLVAFTASTDSPVAALAGLAVLPLWLLDARFLKQERNFRRLYDTIRRGPPPEFGADDYFTMDVGIEVERVESMWRVAAGLSLSLFYAPLLLLIAVSAVVAMQ